MQDNPPSSLQSVVQDLTSQQATLSSLALHPFSAKPEDLISLLHRIVDRTGQLSHSLTAHLSLPLANPKLLSLYRQHATISHTSHISDQNIRLTLDSLRKRSGIAYGEDIPLERAAIVDWCVARLEAWGTSTGMEAFKEEEREGRMTVVLGGKVLVIDIDFSVDRAIPDRPTISVMNLKTSYAIPNGAASSTTQGSLSLDGFLADRLQAFLTEVQKHPEEQDCLQAGRLGKLFSDALKYLMELDQLALSEGDGGLRWFSDIDDLALQTERFATMEVDAIAAARPSGGVPLDIFLARGHTLPLPYLRSPSISFLTYVSPQAYLSLLRSIPPASGVVLEPKASRLKLDIPLNHLRSSLAALPRPKGVTIATLVLSSCSAPISDPSAMDIANFRSRPTFNLVPAGAQADHILIESRTVAPRGWILDFTDGGKYPGVVMSQTRMREIELVVNPLSAVNHIGDVPVMAFGSGNWLDLLLNPESPVSPERYSTVYTSPTSMHPPLQLRLSAPEEPGFVLEKVPVRSLKEVWGILEVVKEQCWLNEAISSHQWVPEGLDIGQQAEAHDTDVTEDDLQAVLKGTFTPRRIPVNIYLPTPSASDPLFDSADIGVMSLSHHSSQSRRPRLIMSAPERPPIPGLVEIVVTFDPSRSHGVALDINGAMGADLNGDVLEEVCRRGGLLGLPGRVWAKSHGAT